MLADGTRLRLFRDSLRDFRFDVEPLRELRPFRMRGPEGRFFREGGPGKRRFFRDGERLRAPRPRVRLRDGEVEIERDDEGRVRVYRFDRPEGDVRPGPGARVERHVLRVGPDGEITGDTDGVRVERDDDGGVRIYIPPRETRPRTPQPPRTRSRD